jgi:hypothetical protein
VRKHARRAIAHFGRVADAGEREFAGFVLADLLAFATRIETEAANWPKMEGDGPAVVFDQPLVPRLRSDTGCHDPR